MGGSGSFLCSIAFNSKTESLGWLVLCMRNAKRQDTENMADKAAFQVVVLVSVVLFKCNHPACFLGMLQTQDSVIVVEFVFT